MFDKESAEHIKTQLRWLIEIFGPGIERYFLKATSSRNLDYRIAPCNLAVQDLKVVSDHKANTVTIYDRYGTVSLRLFVNKKTKAQLLEEIIRESRRYIQKQFSRRFF